MVLVYSVESWILSVVGWAWLSLRESALPRSFMDEFTLYSALGLASVNLLANSLIPPPSRSETQKAFLGAAIAVWLLYVYAILDSVKMPNTGTQYIPVNSSIPNLCCPNQDVPAMNTALFWGGFQWFAAPSAITLSFQTLQVLTGAAGVLSSSETAWPGSSWAYTLGCLLCNLLFLRYAGIPRQPCPNGWFYLLQVIRINYAHVFATLGGGMFFMITLQSFPVSKTLSVATRAGGLILVLAFSLAVCLAGYGRGMLTPPVFSILTIMVTTVAFSLIKPPHVTTPAVEPVKPRATRTRWVLPIQTTQVEHRNDKKSQ